MNNPYITATFALWAGNYARAEQLFAQSRDLNLDAGTASAFVGRAGEARYGQLLKQHADFNRSVSLLADQYHQLKAGGHSLRGTRHLAGVIWRKDTRAFEMRAYPAEPISSKKLVQRARQLALRQKSKMSEFSDDHVIPTGVNFEYPGSFFIQVHVNCLGLTLARGFWTSLELPDFYKDIERGFERVLQDLDPDDENDPLKVKSRSMH